MRTIIYLIIIAAILYFGYQHYKNTELGAKVRSAVSNVTHVINHATHK